MLVLCAVVFFCSIAIKETVILQNWRVSPPVCCRIMYFLANEHETPVQPIDEEEFTKLEGRRNSFRCTEKRKSQKIPAHAQQSSAFPERQLLFTVWPPKKAGSKPVRSQARPRGSEVHRLRKKTKQLNNCDRRVCSQVLSLTRKHPWPHP